MSRFRVVLLLSFVALFALEPVTHTHPLDATSGIVASAPCAACASQTVRVAPAAPTVEAPQTVAYTIAVEPGRGPIVATQRALPARAPPAA
jgi:hypothetical protein